MHELLSLILLSIEIDLLESDMQFGCRAQLMNGLDGGNSSTEKLDVQHECILDSTKSMHDAYIIFEVRRSPINIILQIIP